MHLLSSVYLVGTCQISKNMWDFAQLLKQKKTLTSGSPQDKDKDKETAWTVSVCKKVAQMSATDEELMEIFTLLVHTKINLVDQITRTISFPEEIKKEILEIVSRHQMLINGMLTN